ncbi:MAG TPA: DDE-type integrase/transposase/recombinase [Ferrovibrio sp.]|uniref:DDE-type integrase/transposase/recombinase n=1 Tax=Ferrovibrio sp. TaxID=1917215 RepID=UPI002ED53E52
MTATVLNWEPRTTVRIHDHIYKVHSLTKEGMVNLICLSANDNEASALSKSETELMQLWTRKDLEFLRDPAMEAVDERRRRYLDVPFSSWPVNVQKAALRKYHHVKAWANRKLRRRTPKVLLPIINEMAEEHGYTKVHPRQFARWIADWESIGSPDMRDIRIFAPRYHDRGKNKNRFHPLVQEQCDAVIQEWYLCEQPKTIDEIWGEIKRRVELIDATDLDPRYKDGNVLRTYSRSKVFDELKLVDNDIVVYHQEGPQAWDNKCKPVLRGPQATRPMEVIEIDHTLMDFWAVDYDNMVPLGRPWLTLAIDRYTRMVVGFYISFRAPNAHSVLKCLHQVIMPKDDILAQFPGIKNRWPAMGKPLTIVTDNGSEFHSSGFLGLLHELNIDFQACPAKKPRYKGRVERAIGTMMRGFAHKLPGTTFSNVKQKGLQNPVKAASIDLKDGVHLMLRYIVDEYHVKPHRGLGGMSPLAKWNEYFGLQEDGKLSKSKPVMPARLSDLDEIMTLPKYVPLTREGVRIAGLRYCEDSPELYELINRAGKPDKVKVRVNHDDLSSVQIEDWDTHKYITVPSVDPDYTDGLTMDAHMYYCERRRRMLAPGQKITIEQLIETRHITDQMIADLKRRGKRRSKKLDAYLNGDVLPTKKTKQKAKSEKTEQKKRPAERKPKAEVPELRDEYDTLDEMVERGEEYGISADI